METDKRNEILKAASECFARYGYEKTTLDDIGKLVGLNKASLYYYYKNKESIFTEVILQETNDYISYVMQQVNEVDDCKERIMMYLGERLRFIKNSLNLNQLSRDSSQKVAALFNSMCGTIIEREIAIIAGILEDCIRKGVIIPCDTGKVAKGILTVAEAVRSDIDCRVLTEEAYQTIMDEMLFIVSLMLNGLLKQPSI